MSMLVDKKITIQKGKEYKVCIVEMDNKENFFHDAYLKANTCVEEIKNMNAKENSKDDSKAKTSQKANSINNIIAFCGERGQGKTSAMLSFLGILSQEKIQDKKTYYIMDVIDPTNLEKNDNILMLILSCIFRDFKKGWKNKSNNDIDNSNNKILSYFQKAYHHISIIKSSESSNARDTFDFDDVMNTLDKYGDSTELCVVFKDLIREFLKFSGYPEDSYFVVQIDDTDLNIDRAYEIIEDIRKYLSIPNVIIFMATKFEQLSKIIEQNYMKNFKVMHDFDKDEIKKTEIASMASKYLEKLIPETRRIYLPDLAMGNLSSELPHIIYNDEKGAPILGSGNIQNQLIELIDRKIGISFDIDNLNGTLHPIIPGTMRELVNFLAFLSNMEDVKEDKEKDHKFKIFNSVNNIELIKTLYNNLNAFYNYFKTNWIENHLDSDDIDRIKRIIRANIKTTHMQTLLEIQSKVKSLDLFIQDIKIKDAEKNTESDSLINRITNIINEQSESNLYSYSLGNIMDALYPLDSNVKSYEVMNFTFAIKTIYTIKMMLLAVNDLITQKSQTDTKDTSVLNFIGTDYIGKNCVLSFFHKIGNTAINRGRFKIRIKDFEEQIKANDAEYTNIDDVLKNTYLKYFAVCGYVNSDFDYAPKTSKNNMPFSTLFCNVSYFFIYQIKEAKTIKSNLIFDLLNFEKLFNIVSNQIKDKDPIKGNATLINMYKGFFDRFKDYGFKIDITKEIDNDKIYMDVLNKCLTQPKISDFTAEENHKPISNFYKNNPIDSKWILVKNFFFDKISRSRLSDQIKVIIKNTVEKELSEYEKDKEYSDNSNLTDVEKTELRKKLNQAIKDATSK